MRPCRSSPSPAPSRLPPSRSWRRRASGWSCPSKRWRRRPLRRLRRGRRADRPRPAAARPAGPQPEAAPAWPAPASAYDFIPVDRATALGIPVTNVPGGNAISVAEHVIAQMMVASRRLETADRVFRTEGWKKSIAAWDQAVELSGRTHRHRRPRRHRQAARDASPGSASACGCWACAAARRAAGACGGRGPRSASSRNRISSSSPARSRRRRAASPRRR
jgi:hypothetical protein